MHTPLDTAALRFRRAAFIAAVAGLLCFAWLIYMLLHFNAGTAGFRFGVRTMLGIASITLPGPVLLLFLASQARYAFCRIAGWVAIVPVLAVGAIPAYRATTNLRPPFAPGSYDAAVREARIRANAVLGGPEAPMILLKSLRADFFTRRTSKDGYAALLAGLGVVRGQLEAHAREHAGGAGGLRAVMGEPFDDRAVSPARRDEYLRLVFTHIDPERAAEGFEQTLAGVRGFEARLKLLVDNWGKWRWENERDIRFDDDALKKAYDALPDVEVTP